VTGITALLVGIVLRGFGALRMVDVSSEVDQEGAVVELQSGILKFELPKVAKPTEKAVAAGKV
jgi:hypothetical protein